MNTKIKITLTSIATLAFAFSAAAAIIPPKPGSFVPPNVRQMMSSSTRPYPGMMGSTTRPMGRPFQGSSTPPFGNAYGKYGKNSSSTPNRIERGQDRGGNMLNERIDSLNKLLERIQKMENISSSDKNALISTLEAQIKTLIDLKDKINSDTSTTTLKADLESITKANRVHALVEPKAQITAAADRIKNILEMLSTVKSKIDTRLADVSTPNSTVTNALADYDKKVADTKTQVDAALALIDPLVPDNGDKTKAESNRKALQDARSKIESARNDIQQAHQDLKMVTNTLRTNSRPSATPQNEQDNQDNQN